MLFSICIFIFDVTCIFLKTQNPFYSYGVEFIHLFVYVFGFWVIFREAFFNLSLTTPQICDFIYYIWVSDPSGIYSRIKFDRNPTFLQMAVQVSNNIFRSALCPLIWEALIIPYIPACQFQISLLFFDFHCLFILQYKLYHQLSLFPKSPVGILCGLSLYYRLT